MFVFLDDQPTFYSEDVYVKQISFLPKTESARLRHRILFRLLFLILLTHAVLVYTVPNFAMLTRGTVLWLLEGAPGAMDPARVHPELITHVDGKTYLWGGDNDERFDITQMQLDPARMHWALGREHFKALTEPKFVSIETAIEWLEDDQRVLLVSIGNEARIYPLNILRQHELVNDTIGDHPIFVAFCPLADLAAAYDRKVGERTYTFGVSGYTYDDPDFWDGSEAFVLWDRETESLWWPPIGKAVSGPMIETSLNVLENKLWAQTTWGEVKEQFPNAVVLQQGQAFLPDPSTEEPNMAMVAGPIGPILTGPDGPRPKLHQGPESAIAPRWGENANVVVDSSED